MEWEQIAMELQNKVRWAISTTCEGNGLSIPYREAVQMARVAAGDLLQQLKQGPGEQELRDVRDAIKGHTAPVPWTGPQHQAPASNGKNAPSPVTSQPKD